MGLTRIIDQQILDRWRIDGVSPAGRCRDETFVRRIYLDLAGRIPTVAETESFLADQRKDRRVVLIDQLLESEDYVQHVSDLFDALLMGRAPEQKYAARESQHWRSYLESVIRDNRAWNEVVAEILLARPTDQDNRGAVWFLYERNNQHQLIAESIAPAFFGIRIECAQCHDHMNADEIRQEHYWGLVAFFNRSKNQDTPNGPRVAESAIGGFSEFSNIEGESSPNILTFLGADPVEESRPGKDQQQEDADALYDPASIEGDPRVPKFSRRQQFVHHVVNGNPLVARALVNRVWAIMMGRGIVHPFDEMDSVHQPSHPELLDQLTQDCIAAGYDIRRLFRALALSQPYQLDSRRPAGIEDPASFAWYLERPLTAEQLARSISVMLRGGSEFDSELVAVLRPQFKEVLPDENVVTVSDTLFLSNNPRFNQILRNSTDQHHLIPRLLTMPVEQRADALCHAAFGRPAAPDEMKAIVDYLNARNDNQTAALQQVAWSLINSAEFRFNH